MFLKWSNLFRTETAGGWRARWVKRIVNLIKMVAEGVKESGDAAHRDKFLPPPLSCYILLCLPLLSLILKLNYSSHSLTKSSVGWGKCLHVPGFMCTSSASLFEYNIRLLLNLVQSVSPTLDVMDMTQLVWLR